jgi:serine-type D-Ala-D-Ala carboxypeptidase/endopeptidase (penicillin-binding protein 4)
MSTRLAALAALFATALIPLSHARDSQLPPALVRAMSRAGVPPADLSIYVRDAATNEIVLELGAQTPRAYAVGRSSAECCRGTCTWWAVAIRT